MEGGQSPRRGAGWKISRENLCDPHRNFPEWVMLRATTSVSRCTPLCLQMPVCVKKKMISAFVFTETAFHESLSGAGWRWGKVLHRRANGRFFLG